MAKEGHAQSVTYNHDDTKMKQITVMEIGTGTLTPEAYYKLFHNSYKKTANEKNKLSFRTLAGVSSYEQVEDAEKVDSALTKRAEIEALNIADRSGGALDLAWKTEKGKINDKMNAFQNNINRIVPAGGSIADKQLWDEYYQVFKYAIQATQDAYMPNSQRKKQYLKIYEDVDKRNNLLVQHLVDLARQTKTKELLSARGSSTRVDKSSVTATSLGRWRNTGAANSTNQGSGSSSTGGSGDESVVR